MRRTWKKSCLLRKRLVEDSSVYEIQPEKGEGRTRVLHRTLLLPFDYLDTERAKQTRTANCTNRNREGQTKVNRKHQEPSESDSECALEEGVPQIDPKDLKQFRDRIEMFETDETILRETIDNDDIDIAEDMSEQSISNLS